MSSLHPYLPLQIQDLTLQHDALANSWKESTTLLETSKAALATFQEETDILSLKLINRIPTDSLLIQLQLGEVAGFAPEASTPLKRLG